MAYQPTILNGETVFRNEVFQTGLMSQLLDGIYDGEMTIGELLSHGNFGVGTNNGLDGEMVVLDGVCYQVRHDGSVSLPDLRQQTPYAVVTNFVPMIKRELPHNLLRKSASQILDDFTVSRFTASSNGSAPAPLSSRRSPTRRWLRPPRMRTLSSSIT